MKQSFYYELFSPPISGLIFGTMVVYPVQH